IMLSIFGFLSSRRGLSRIVWLAPLALFVFALHLTQSRGGLIAALASTVVLLLGRFGIRKGVLMAALALPLIFSQVGGRQSQIDLNDPESTAQGRVKLSSRALEVFKTSPLFGVGPNQTAVLINKAVHNSYVQVYSELGIVGGSVYVGLFYLSFRRLFRLQF